jgi:hypothetical protein
MKKEHHVPDEVIKTKGSSQSIKHHRQPFLAGAELEFSVRGGQLQLKRQSQSRFPKTYFTIDLCLLFVYSLAR